MQHQRRVFPVNPYAAQIEGLTAYAALDALPEPVYGLSIITPSYLSETIVAQAVALGIGHVWMQPWAESPNAIQWGSRSSLTDHVFWLP
jgi:predicted CoA-binding protein